MCELLCEFPLGRCQVFGANWTIASYLSENKPSLLCGCFVVIVWLTHLSLFEAIVFDHEHAVRVALACVFQSMQTTWTEKQKVVVAGMVMSSLEFVVPLDHSNPLRGTSKLRHIPLSLWSRLCANGQLPLK